MIAFVKGICKAWQEILVVLAHLRTDKLRHCQRRVVVLRLVVQTLGGKEHCTPRIFDAGRGRCIRRRGSWRHGLKLRD